MKIFQNQRAKWATRVLVLTLAFGGFIASEKSAIAEDKDETVYERVQRTNTIRCGYSVWEPLFFIDANTGEKKGIFHDLMEETGKRLEIKIEWQEELGWGNVVEAVKTGRVDMACAGYWTNHARIKNLQTNAPQFYSPLYVYVRQDEAREFGSLENMNLENFTVTTIDGSAERQILERRFPNVKRVDLPELNTSADLIQNLLTKKSDFIILDSGTANAYLKANPNTIKPLFVDQPVMAFPTTMLLPADDFALKGMIDNILNDMELDGTLDAILKKYNVDKVFLRNHKPMAGAGAGASS